MFRIKVDDKEARQIAVAISAATKRLKPLVEANAAALAQVASGMIYENIANIPTIGMFLLPRTRIDTTFTGDTIVLSISGLSEGEAKENEGYYYNGGEPKDNMNLWAWHEFGGTSDEGDMQSFTKDVGGVTREVTRRSSGAGSPYEGAVRDTIESLTVQLNTALQSVGAIAGYNVLASAVTTATRGKVQVARGARAALKAAGISNSFLASMGATKVGVTTRGQIFVLGQGPGGGFSFLPMRSMGIPTTIRTR